VKLIIGDTTEELSLFAKDCDPSAYLIDFSNYKDTHTGICYTSLGDLPSADDLKKLILSAHEVYYHNHKHWSHYDLKLETEYILANLEEHHHIKIDNFSMQSIDYDLSDARATDDNQLWFAGCSLVAGTGVSKTERYAHLVAKQLGKEYTMLAFPGSSIYWAGDQILRSDIRSGDTIIWGLTSLDRWTAYALKTPIHCLPELTTRNLLQKQDFAKEIKQYDAITTTFIKHELTASQMWARNSILQVQNFCSKIGAQLLFVGHLDWNIKRWVKLPNYLDLKKEYIDLGSDGQHPGPEQHKWYAKTIIEYLDTHQDLVV